MVEMFEIVNIFKLVIVEFLIIIDEFGCGILIYDGFGFVWVIFEYIIKEIGCFVMFVMYFYEFMVFVE